MKKQFLKASRIGIGRASHSHVVLLDPETNQMEVSTDFNHTHEITLDPLTNLPSLLPAADGHTHVLSPLEPLAPKKQKKDDAELIESVLSDYKGLLEYESESLTAARESDEFYTGKQWSDADKSTLESQSRAALTINKIQRSIDELCGYQRQNRSDWKCLPFEESDARLAEIGTILLKHVDETNDFRREESEAFEDTTIVGRGAFNLYVDYNSELLPEVRIERFEWDNLLVGPHNKKDLSDLELLVKTKWYTKDRLASIYPDKRDVLTQDMELCSDPSAKSHTTYSDDQYARAFSSNTGANPHLINTVKKEFRVIERWKRVYEPSTVITDGITAENISNFDPRDIASIKTLQSVQVIEREVPRMRVTKIANRVLLSDQTIDKDFHITLMYCKKRKHKWWGKVESAKDPQREINKRHSQAVDIANKMAAYGWFYDANTFVDSKEKEKFKNTSAKPGFMVEVAELSRLPAKVEGVKFPSELVQLLSLGDSQLLDIMNITVDQMGANESGAMLLQKLKQKLIGNEHLFDALALARKRIGRQALALIQETYSPDRIARIVLSSSQRQAEDPNQPQDPGLSYDDLIAFIENSDLTKLDVVVDEIAQSPTARLGIFLLFSELARNGLPIPPQTLIRFMDQMPATEKEAVLNDIAMQQQAAAEAEQAKYNAEIQKTQIAKGENPAPQQLAVPVP